jgi:DNA repair photolyase
MKRFTGHKEKWGDFLDVKNCNKKIKSEKYTNRTILLSSVTDCYNQFERKYNKTKNILKQFIGTQCKISILTKSGLVTRDIDILRNLHDVEVGFSFSSLDERFQKIMEPHAASTQKKLGALKTLYDAGIRVWVFISPFFPKLTDYKAIIASCRTYTSKFSFERLKLRPLYKTRVLRLIKNNFPEVWYEYDLLFNHGSSSDYWSIMKNEIIDYCKKEKLDYEVFFETDHRRKSG